MAILSLVFVFIVTLGGYLTIASDPYSSAIWLYAVADTLFTCFVMMAIPICVKRINPAVWKSKGKTICKWNILIAILVLMLIDVIKIGGFYDKVFQNMGENFVYALMFYFENTRSLKKKKKSPDEKSAESSVIGNWTKASPAKTTNAILLPFNCSARRFTSLLAFSRRLGYISSASIELETSNATTNSTPRVVTDVLPLP